MMDTRAKTLLALVLLAVAAWSVAAQETRFGAMVVSNANLLDKAATSGKTVVAVATGQPVVILEKGAKPEKVDGKDAPWYKVKTKDGKSGFIHGSKLRVPYAPFAPDQFDSYEYYSDYVRMLLRPGERVAASMDSYDYDVRAGDLGWFFGSDADGGLYVVWDKDIGTQYYRDYLPKGFPAELSDRLGYCYPGDLKIVGIARTAVFTDLAAEWTRAQPVDQAFPEGSIVALQKYVKVQDQDPASEGWKKDLDKYVGKEGTVLYYYGFDDWLEPMFVVDAGGEEVIWRAYSMKIVEKADYYVYDYGYGDYGDYGDEYGYDDYYAIPFPESDTTGNVLVGDTVILGEHDEVDGSKNWDKTMKTFVGKKGKVTALIGADSSGCNVLTVDVDKGKWVWRVRNLEVVGKGISGSYGFKVGDRVILGRHREVNGYDYWATEMNQYVGQVATITEIVGWNNDPSCFVVHVDADDSYFYWRVENMVPYKGK